MAAASSNRVPGSGPSTLAAEPLQPQELVMTMLGSYVRPHHELVWSGGLVELLAEMGFSTGASRVALTRLGRRDLIARVREGRLIHYCLTERAERLLAEGDRRIFSLGRAGAATDDWTILWHDIPEPQRVKRTRLGRRLRFLGFGTLQDGLWVSPHDREEEVVPLLEELDVAERAVIVVGRVVDGSAADALVRRAWDLDTLCARYRAFADEFAPYAKRRGAPRLDDRQAFLARTRLMHVYRGFPFLDPDLPDALMPDADARRRAISVFDRAYEQLAGSAQLHFDRITSRTGVNA